MKLWIIALAAFGLSISAAEAFQSADLDGSGELSAEELAIVIAAAG